MVKLSIDNQVIEVPKGTKVITAAEKLGIFIPRFCFHPALGAVGACRVCAVNILEGPVSGIQMSCMVEATDKMVVSTSDKKAVDFRRQVLEWLMLNHPHDCPVCDEGGHCLLQDLTVSCGHGIRSYQGNKRTHHNQYLGPFVAHEMNRCIQCYRCVRLYREYFGANDFGVMGIGSRVYFGRQKEGALLSPFAGNLIDVCPTGVLTDVPSRHKGRRWDFERTPSICTHCALGCNIIVSARYREVVRCEARENSAINGYFICDRGRYGYAYANDQDRPRAGIINGQFADTKKTMDQLTAELSAVVLKYGSEAVAVAGSCRSSLETLGAVNQLCRSKNYFGPVLYESKQLATTNKQAAARFSFEHAVDMEKMLQSDFILAVGVDPLNEAPMLAPALRQAVLNGAKLVVADPRPIELSCPFEQILATPEDLSVRLAGLLQAGLGQEVIDAVDGAAALFDAMEAAEIDANAIDLKQEAYVVQALKKSRRPIIICGIRYCDQTTVDLSAFGVRLLKKSSKEAGLLYVFSQANSLAAGRLAPLAGDYETLLEKMEAGQIKALISVEWDPWTECFRRDRLETALQNLDLIVGMDAVLSPWVSKCRFFLPTFSVNETGGIFINTLGMAQTAQKALAGGTPILQTGAENHPPRAFAPDIPGSDLVAPATVLAQLAGTSDDAASWAAKGCGEFQELLTLWQQISINGKTLALDEMNSTLQTALPQRFEKQALRLLVVEKVFGTERLSSLAPAIIERTDEPQLKLHPIDADRRQLMDGSLASLQTQGKEIAVPVKITPKTAMGVAVLARHRDLEWQRLESHYFKLAPEHLRPINKE